MGAKTILEGSQSQRQTSPQGKHVLSEGRIFLEVTSYLLSVLSLICHVISQVIHPYVPSESDELELRTGDYVYLSGEALANSPDGWVEGISWLTGLSGLLPESYTQRTAESDAWTLHRKISLNQQSGSLTKKLTKEGKSSEMDQPQLPTWPTQEFLRDYADVREHREENGDVKPVIIFFTFRMQLNFLSLCVNSLEIFRGNFSSCGTEKE